VEMRNQSVGPCEGHDKEGEWCWYCFLCVFIVSIKGKNLIWINISIFIHVRGVEGEMIKGGGSDT
jgi:hypothetical protein